MSSWKFQCLLQTSCSEFNLPQCLGPPNFQRNQLSLQHVDISNSSRNTIWRSLTQSQPAFNLIFLFLWVNKTHRSQGCSRENIKNQCCRTSHLTILMIVNYIMLNATVTEIESFKRICRIEVSTAFIHLCHYSQVQYSTVIGQK